MPVPANQFLLNLAKDPKALSSFHQNPQAALSSANLSPQVSAAIKSRNPAEIQKAFSALQSKADSADDITVVVVITP